MEGEVDITTVLGGKDHRTERFFETFYAHHAGHCLRQLYLSKLDLLDSDDDQERLDTRQRVQEHIAGQFKQQYPRVTQSPRLSVQIGSLSFVGRPTCVDPEPTTVYHIKPRDGWYKFHPPNDRHLNQMEVYLRASNADRGRLIYVSMANHTDYRLWPPDGYLVPDSDRFDEIIARAQCVRDEIVANGVATTPTEVPFDPCDCYLCQSESLAFDGAHVTSSSSTSAITSAADSTPRASGVTDDEQSHLVLDREAEVRETDGRHVPTALRELDIWVVWDSREKLALAPWQSGTMYPCRWAADSGCDPRRSFEKAKMVSELSVEEVHRIWPFPDGTALPETVEPAVLLPHNPPRPPVAVIDLDDVRDPETAEVTGEALAIVDELGGYTEVSRSGTGLHTFVRGQLPADRGMVSAPLEESGQIEIYDHARFVGGTWRHLAGAPMDAVPDAQAVLEKLVRTYG